MKHTKLSLIIIFVATYLLSTGLTYATLSFTIKRPSLISPDISGAKLTGKQALQINPAEIKDKECLLNGKLFTQTEKQAWEKRRPIVTMIENTPEARPQSGLSRADIVYEAIAEGGITRFMGVFYCAAQADQGKVAPVRSARIYFVNLATEYNNPIYVHVGGGNCSRNMDSKLCTSDKRAWALEELVNLGWRRQGGNDFDTTFDIGVPSLRRDQNRLGPDIKLATEHTMVGDLSSIWKEAKKRDLTSTMADGDAWDTGFTSWKFSSDQPSNSTDMATDINFDFGSWGDYSSKFAVNWSYNPSTQLYSRKEGNEKHIDLENNKQITAKTVIIQSVKQTGPIDEHKHMLYGVIGKGKATIFQNGKAIKANWKKKTQKSRTIFTLSNNKEFVFSPGIIWIEILPTTSQVKYK